LWKPYVPQRNDGMLLLLLLLLLLSSSSSFFSLTAEYIVAFVPFLCEFAILLRSRKLALTFVTIHEWQFPLSRFCERDGLLCVLSASQTNESLTDYRVLAPEAPWYAGTTGAIIVDVLSNSLRHFLTCTISVHP